MRHSHQPRLARLTVHGARCALPCGGWGFLIVGRGINLSLSAFSILSLFITAPAQQQQPTQDENRARRLIIYICGTRTRDRLEALLYL